MLLTSLFAALLAGQAAAEPQEQLDPRYADCVQFVEADLELGRIAAQQWVDEGGGAEARHCLAVADLKAGFPKLAALRLEDIAQRKDAGDDYVRARLYAQAAEAWLAAGENAYSGNALGQALSLVPDSAELQLTAAKVYAAQLRWKDVIDAVDAAEEGGFVSAETYVLRGRGRYIVGAHELAAEDVVAALTIEPVNIDALVLRGDLAQAGITIDVFFDPPKKP